jgi:hypothetical protein
MAKHNFKTPEITPGPEMAKDEVEKLSADDVITVTNDTYAGTVVNCSRLNVREQPDPKGTVLGEIVCGSLVLIDEAESTADWYKVCAEAGLKGFCMKKFVEPKS